MTQDEVNALSIDQQIVFYKAQAYDALVRQENAQKILSEANQKIIQLSNLAGSAVVEESV